MTWPFSTRREQAKKERAIIAKVAEAKLDKEVEEEAKKLVEKLGEDKITLEEATTYLRAIKRPMPFADKLLKLKGLLEKAGGGAEGGPTPLDRALGMWDIADSSEVGEEPQERRRKSKKTAKTADQDALSTMGIEIREPDLFIPKS